MGVHMAITTVPEDKDGTKNFRLEKFMKIEKNRLEFEIDNQDFRMINHIDVSHS